MLEEALRNEKQSPAETALAMLAFVQVELNSGGSAAEQRFFKLYVPLCDRIFGPIDEQNDYKHAEGGWLSWTSPWSRTPVSVGSSPSPRGRTMASNAASSLARHSLDADPVVKLLGTAGKPTGEPLPPTLIEAISVETVTRPLAGFPFPFFALPKPMQDSWLALMEDSLGGKSAGFACTDNEKRLMGTLLQKRPNEQTELLRYRQRAQQTKQDPRHSSRQQLSPRLFGSPLSNSTIPSPASVTPKSKDATGERLSPPILLSMLEYYLFLYLRYPLALPPPKAPPAYSPRSSSSRLHSRKKEPYGEQVYCHLFRRYLGYFLPYEAQDGRSIRLETRDSELFLRLLICLWIESMSQVTPTQKVTQAIQERRQEAGITEPITFDLCNSYDLVQAKYEPPPQLVQRCLRNLIVHVILDPAISNSVVESSSSSSRQFSLSPSLTILQQPFYNLVRSTFRYASIHATDSPFYSILNLWLIWIEPWNLTQSKVPHATQRIIGSVSRTVDRKPASRALSIPKYNQASKYNKAWEPYIAANLYVYTVPLAIFLRRARELDFSAAKFDRSVEIVRRVFRVFTPDVVDAVSRNLNGDPKWAHFVTQHVQNLGPYAMPPGHLSISSCQPDGRGLLEEIYMQHSKQVRELDVFERFGAYLEGLFGQGVVSGQAKALDGLVERTKLIVGLPVEYEIEAKPLSRPSTVAGQKRDDSTGPARDKQGFLTDKGKEQVVTGAVKCSPMDISYVGDKLRARPGSHEIPWFVHLTIEASDYLNHKFQVRFINLRFFADYRNLLFVCVTLYVLTKILF